MTSQQRRIRLLIWMLITGALALIASRADFSSDLSALLPSDNKQLKRQLAFFAERGAAQIMAVEAWSDDPGRTEDAKRSLRSLAQEFSHLKATPVEMGNAESAARTVELIHQHLPVLLTPEQLGRIKDLIASESLRRQLNDIKERALRPDDQFAAAAGRGDCLALSALVYESCRGHLPSGTIDEGVIVHADGQHCLLLVEVGFSPNDLIDTDRLMAACDQAQEAAAKIGVRLEPIGSYRHFRDNFHGIWHDLIATMPLGLVMIALLLYSLIRSWRAVGALHVPAALAFLAAVASLALFFDQVPLTMLGFGAAFIGVSVENAIHMTTAIQNGEEAHVRRPLIMSFLTTVAAFAVLMWSSIPALRCLGVEVVGGLLIALMASLTLLPALVRQREKSNRRDRWGAISGALIRWSEGPARTRIALAALVTVLTVPGMFSISSHRGLHLVDDLKQLDGSKPETWQALDAFLSRWNGFETSDFYVSQQETLDDALEKVAVARANDGFGLGLVEALLPSQAEQARRLAAWNDLWRQEWPGFTTRFNDTARSLGLKPEAFADSMQLYRPRESVAPVTLETWADTPLERILEGLVQPIDGAWQVASPLEHADLMRVREASLREDGEAWISSRAGMARALVEVTGNDLAKRGLAMLGAMTLLVVLMERRLRLALSILIPPTLAMLWTYGVLGWLGAALTPFSVMVAAFVAGIGLDTAIFLAQSERRAQALSPGLACAISTIAGVGSLISASSPLLANAGQAVAIGMVACIAACLLLTPAIAGRSGSVPTSP